MYAVLGHPFSTSQAKLACYTLQIKDFRRNFLSRGFALLVW
jgi:hypothetical protein